MEIIDIKSFIKNYRRYLMQLFLNLCPIYDGTLKAYIEEENNDFLT